MRTKKMTWGLATVAAVLLLLPLTAFAQAPDATLYELTENMRVKGGQITHRLATSALGGFAQLGSVLCPPQFVTGSSCFVNAVGSDNINTSTRKGPISGDFTVVVQEPFTVDSPEFVVMRGTFQGSIDLSPTLIGVALGTMDGHLKSPGIGKRNFRGVFRLPFLCGQNVYCYMTSGPDGVWHGGFLFVQPGEFALGYPMVRLEIYIP